MILITGLPGSGKTSLCNQLHRSKDLDFIGSWVDGKWIVDLDSLSKAKREYNHVVGLCDNLKEVIETVNPKCIVYLDTDYKEWFKRMDARNRKIYSYITDDYLSLESYDRMKLELIKDIRSTGFDLNYRSLSYNDSVILSYIESKLHASNFIFLFMK